jgi:hypothetical protein
MPWAYRQVHKHLLDAFPGGPVSWIYHTPEPKDHPMTRFVLVHDSGPGSAAWRLATSCGRPGTKPPLLLDLTA